MNILTSLSIRNLKLNKKRTISTKNRLKTFMFTLHLKDIVMQKINQDIGI